MTREVLLRDVDVDVDGRRVDVRVVGPAIAEVSVGLAPGPGAEVVDGEGGALIPGLHDHHLHLLATAAARSSVPVGPPTVSDHDGFARALRAADAALEPGRWLRALGYHESVAGDLDRSDLDRLLPTRPARVQHRSGARWTLNSAAIDALHLDERADLPAGVERDTTRRLTGRVHRADDWLRTLLPATAAPDLARLGTELSAHGVTGVTDTTPFATLGDLVPLADAVAGGALPQHVVATGSVVLAAAAFPAALERGPVKVVVDDGAYPALDDLAADLATAHRAARPVAVHCVTRTALVLALAAWDIAGSHPGDRIEHGAVVPPELIDRIRHHRLTVVTQPGFVAERGDQYRADVDPDDLPYLYPCARLLAAGVPVAGSTDAPYTSTDPWAAMRAAVERRTPTGAVLGRDERITAVRALQLFLGSPHDPGGAARRVAPGEPADLVLLAVPLAQALADLSATNVRRTIHHAERAGTPPASGG